MGRRQALSIARNNNLLLVVVGSGSNLIWLRWVALVLLVICVDLCLRVCRHRCVVA